MESDDWRMALRTSSVEAGEKEVREGGGVEGSMCGEVVKLEESRVILFSKKWRKVDVSCGKVEPVRRNGGIVHKSKEVRVFHSLQGSSSC